MKNTNTGLSLTSIVFIVFLILKLTGNIDWSWWWVTSPLWLPVCVLLVIFVITVLISLLYIAHTGESVDGFVEKFLKKK
jgi:hypothetical protein